MIAVGYDNESFLTEAQTLAARLHLPIDNQANQQLYLSNDGLGLKIAPFLPVYANFESAHWQPRRDAGKQQGIVKACKPKQGLRILDTTAGWGRDAAVLASFGAEVLMLERHPIMAALLADALARQDKASQLKLKLTLLNQDAKDYLLGLSGEQYPDVIYIDPMHPAREKTALVKKDLQMLQTLIGPDTDALELIQLAQTRARQRIVVKWPQHQPYLLKPNQQVQGKTVRFDVYTNI